MDLDKTGMMLRYPQGAQEDISRYLAESELAEGAYRCTVPGFLDCYHMLKRVVDRSGPVCFSLYLCTILDAGGHPASSREYCDKMEERLRVTLRRLLRRGDVYTKYSECQYLLLCVGAKKENVLQIGDRIAVDFRKQCGGRGDISFRLLDSGGGW